MDKLAAGIFLYEHVAIRAGKRKFMFFSLLVGMLLLQANLFSQIPTLKTSVDRKEILIGQQFNLHISAVYNPAVAKITWFQVPDSIPHFEIIDQGRTDTIRSGEATMLQQTITLTSFDSGVWRLPSMMINFDPLQDDNDFNYLTDSLPVKVSYLPDTTNAIRDIKPIWEVSITDYFWYYVIGGIVALLLIITGIIIYLKKRKKKPAPMFKSNLSAYEEARQELEKLKLLDLTLPADAKQYHTRLSEIFRRYASRKLNVNLMTRTTDGILLELKDKQFDPSQLSKAAGALRSGDAVKFAKYHPPVYESENVLKEIKDTIDLMEQANTTSAGQTRLSS